MLGEVALRSIIVDAASALEVVLADQGEWLERRTLRDDDLCFVRLGAIRQADQALARLRSLNLLSKASTQHTDPDHGGRG